MRHVEILFSDFYLYGDRGNVELLQKIFEHDQVIKTQINDELYFVDHEVDLIFIGPMTEKNLQRVAQKLLPYKDRLQQLIDQNVYILATGNALEVFVKELQDTDGQTYTTLGLIDCIIKRNLKGRHDIPVMGKHRDYFVTGYIASFSQMYGHEAFPFLKVTRGYGSNKQSDFEGVRLNNFIGTFLLGPILVLNPPLAKEVAQVSKLPFEDQLQQAYTIRVDLFEHNAEFKKR